MIIVEPPTLMKILIQVTGAEVVKMTKMLMKRTVTMTCMGDGEQKVTAATAERLPRARRCARCFAQMISPNPLHSPVPLCRRGTRVQRDTVTCPRPHSQLTAELGPAPGQPDPGAHALPHKDTRGACLGSGPPSPLVDLTGWPSSCPLRHT